MDTYMPYIFGVVRALLATGAGVLINHGWLATTQVEPITGAIILILTTAWSIYSKKTTVQEKSK